MEEIRQSKRLKERGVKIWVGARNDLEEFDPVAEAEGRLALIERMLETLRGSEEEWLRWGFAERLFELIAPLGGRGEMRNEALLRFAKRGYERKVKLEVETWRRAVNLFRGMPSSHLK
ncbi:MAG: hypothetical protein QXR65_05340 [Candidatus Bathyarchaeia archaeon]|nr:hypothetical protein [Candidatus Bathyarchaeota archaeon]